MSAPFELTLGDALRAIWRGTLSAEDVARACLERIRDRDPQIRAFQHLAPSADVVRLAREGRGKGRLEGLPIAVKDIIETAGLPTEFGSLIHRGNTPATDAACVALLKCAGGTVVGKTATAELGYLDPPQTRNPRDLDRTPGGSSSGSAAAVADCMVPAALGAQTAGSVTRPASYCGVVGYVATHGELPLRGVQPLSPSLDALGIFTRSVEDAQLLRSILLDVDPPSQQVGSRVRIAVVLPTTLEIEPEMIEATNQAAIQLDSAGADLQSPELGELIPELIEHHATIMAFEVARSLAYEAGFEASLSEHVREVIEEGRSTSYGTYCGALAAVEGIGRQVGQVLAHNDAILAPAAPGPAPLGRSSTGSPDMSRPWQVLGLPTVALPTRPPQEGPPLGVQLVGSKHGDDRLLGVASWAEAQVVTTAVEGEGRYGSPVS